MVIVARAGLTPFIWLMPTLRSAHETAKLPTITPMARKRGAPVLVELIKRSPTGTHSASDSVAPYATTTLPPPPRAGDPRATSGLADSAAWSHASSLANRTDLRLWAVVIGGAIVLTIVGLWIGHRMGRKAGVDEWARTLPAEPTPSPNFTQQPSRLPRQIPDLTQTATPVVLPANNPGSITTPRQNTDSKPALVAPAPGETPSPEDDFTPGHNYLVVATLPYREATEVGQFLASKGLGAKLIPKGRVDLESAQTKNLPCEVIVLRGFAPDEFSARAKEREELMTRVKRLGRLWKAENRKVPSDFADAWFKKF